MSTYTRKVRPGAIVSWRHANGHKREAGWVVAVEGDTLVVDITDNAGTYRFAGTPVDFPGLTVDVEGTCAHAYLSAGDTCATCGREV